MGFVKNEEKDIKGIFSKIKHRDFKGNEGIAIKNSFIQSFKTIVSKLGGFIFTILLARLLMPELFGLYSLVTSAIFIFVGFSELGLGSALIRYVSKSLKKGKEKKAKGYAAYLLKLKLILVVSLFLIFIISSKFIANYYDKPIFLALIAGSLFLICSSLITFLEYLFYSINKFKESFAKEIVYQILRVASIVVVVFFLIKPSSTTEFNLFLIIIGLSLSSLFALILLIILIKKRIYFLKGAKQELNKKEKKDLISFILPLSAMVLSGIFFGYIDTIMLGKFVSAEFIGYYNAAFKLAVSITPLISFSMVLLPIFSRLDGERLEKGFRKTRNLVFILSLGLFLVMFIFAPLIIKIVFGNQYLNSILSLRILSFILISAPLSKIYESYLVSKGNSKILAKVLIFATILNIILNYILITRLLVFGEGMAILGAAIATIISRFLILFCLFISTMRMKRN